MTDDRFRTTSFTVVNNLSRWNWSFDALFSVSFSAIFLCKTSFAKKSYNYTKWSLIQDRGQGTTRVAKSTRISQMWYRKPFSKNSLVADITQDTLTNYSFAVMIIFAKPNNYNVILSSFIIVNNSTKKKPDFQYLSLNFFIYLSLP